MSARRQARARQAPLARPSAPSAVPAALLIGRCVEVWADPVAEIPSASAMRRFDRAREHFGALIGATDAELRELIPDGSPWTVEYFTYRGQAERAGRPVREMVAERLDRAGCTVEDIPPLRAEAAELFAAALGGGALTRAARRAHRQTNQLQETAT